MKKLTFLFLTILLPMIASADPVLIDGIYYNLYSYNNTAEVTKKTSGYYNGSIYIPSSVTFKGNEYTVTSIGYDAFYGNKGLSFITIPNSIKSIGEKAFSECSGLIKVELNNNEILSKSYTDEYSLRNIFGYQVKNYILGNSVTTIGEGAFRNCSRLTYVEIPNTVTYIDKSAFSGCSGLESVTIPNSVSSIGSSAFERCSGLTSLTIGNSVTEIGESAFSYCSGLTSVIIPNSVTSIAIGAFYGCSGLTSVTIGSSVTSIGNYAFFECSGLTSVNIPNSVTSIGEYAFDSSVWFDNYPEGVVYIGYIAYKYQGIMPDSTSIILKEGTKEIADIAFRNCSGLTSITIPNSVTSIGNGSFSDCFGLTSIDIPNSVTSIGSYAFSGCSNLTSVSIPNSVTSIGESAFYGTAWYKNQSDGLIYAGNVVYGYKGDMPENTSISIKEGTLGIADYAFKSCTNLKSIYIPNSVTSIGNYAFYECSGLTSVNIPNSVTSIGSGAFYKCSGLTSVNIPNSLTSIGDYAFCLCSGLSTITIPKGVISIERGAFSRSGLTSITIPENIESIGEGAFGSCSKLSSITIPNSVTSIGEGAFSSCTELADVYCYAEKIPTINYSDRNIDIFKNSHIEFATLYVPHASIMDYYNTLPWRGFGTIKSLGQDKKCATPTINIDNGKLKYACETEGVELHYEYSFSQGGKGIGSESAMPQIIIVSVYATKSGYEDSDVATKEIEVSGGSTAKKGDVNEDGNVNGTDIQEVINIIVNEE